MRQIRRIDESTCCGDHNTAMLQSRVDQMKNTGRQEHTAMIGRHADEILRGEPLSLVKKNRGHELGGSW